MASIAVTILLSATASGQPLQFELLTSTANPMGGARPFSSTPPAIEGTTVGFAGRPVSSLGQAMYVFPIGGTAIEVARTGTFAPDGSVLSSIQNTPSISNGRVVFYAGTDRGQAIYTNVRGSLERVVGPGFTPLPGSLPGASRWGARPSLNGNTIAFSADGTQFTPGLYTWTAETGVKRVVDGDTRVPGQPTQFLGGYIINPEISGGRVAFTSFGGPTGVYVADADGQNIQAIIQGGQTAPGGVGTFKQGGVNTHWITADGNSVLFTADTTTTSGLWVSSGGVLRVVADTRTRIPGRTATFGPFGPGTGEFAISGSNIVFSAKDTSGKQGIYGDFGFGLRRIIEEGDQLDGSTIRSFYFGREGLDGNRLVFQATLESSVVGIYVVTILPAPWTCVVLGAIVCRRQRRC